MYCIFSGKCLAYFYDTEQICCIRAVTPPCVGEAMSFWTSANTLLFFSLFKSFIAAFFDCICMWQHNRWQWSCFHRNKVNLIWEFIINIYPFRKQEWSNRSVGWSFGHVDIFQSQTENDDVHIYLHCRWISGCILILSLFIKHWMLKKNNHCNSYDSDLFHTDLNESCS